MNTVSQLLVLPHISGCVGVKTFLHTNIAQERAKYAVCIKAIQYTQQHTLSAESCVGSRSVQGESVMGQAVGCHGTNFTMPRLLKEPLTSNDEITRHDKGYTTL